MGEKGRERGGGERGDGRGREGGREGEMREGCDSVSFFDST